MFIVHDESPESNGTVVYRPVYECPKNRVGIVLGCKFVLAGKTETTAETNCVICRRRYRTDGHDRKRKRTADELCAGNGIVR